MDLAGGLQFNQYGSSQRCIVFYSDHTYAPRRLFLCRSSSRLSLARAGAVIYFFFFLPPAARTRANLRRVQNFSGGRVIGKDWLNSFDGRLNIPRHVYIIVQKKKKITKHYLAPPASSSSFFDARYSSQWSRWSHIP